MACRGNGTDRCLMVFLFAFMGLVCLVTSAPTDEPGLTEAPSPIDDDVPPEQSLEVTLPTDEDEDDVPDNDEDAGEDVNEDDVTPPAPQEEDEDAGEDVNEDDVTPPAPQEEDTTEATESPSVEGTTEPPSSPVVVNFTLKDENGDICLKAEFSAWFACTYKSIAEDSKSVMVPVPQNADAEGTCGDIYSQSSLVVKWGKGYSLTMTFDTDQKNSSLDKRDAKEVEGIWCANSLEFKYDTSDEFYFPEAVDGGAKTVHTLDDVTFFDTTLTKSYKCDTQDDIMLEADDDYKEKVVLKIADLHLQPYNIEDGEFGESELCEADTEVERRIDSTVPIAVGAALGCLILIVIIVYAIGRQFGALGTGYTGYKSVD